MREWIEIGCFVLCLVGSIFMIVKPKVMFKNPAECTPERIKRLRISGVIGILAMCYMIYITIMKLS